ncbi:uncharacterized protein LOC124113338 isoform X2 [Haliotis rufescens]|uniref:uncharacterized protein LOC124113338 isoform X2 n=1 Tax=Haliotis rufescens TaxID=6454 RepID=UPI00201F3BDD|nr:uncharacterized protein LOC124113338 isoform X2 [Haliotis rufescens]
MSTWAQCTEICLHGHRTQGYVYMGTGHRGMSTWAQDTGVCLHGHRGMSTWAQGYVYMGTGHRGMSTWAQGTEVCLHGHSEQRYVYMGTGHRGMSTWAQGTEVCLHGHRTQGMSTWAQDTGVCLHGHRAQRYVYMGTGHRGMSTWTQRYVYMGTGHRDMSTWAQSTEICPHGHRAQRYVYMGTGHRYVYMGTGHRGMSTWAQGTEVCLHWHMTQVCLTGHRTQVCLHGHRAQRYVYMGTVHRDMSTWAQDTGVCLHGHRAQRYVYMGTGHRGMSTWAQRYVYMGTGVCLHGHRTQRYVYMGTEHRGLSTWAQGTEICLHGHRAQGTKVCLHGHRAQRYVYMGTVHRDMSTWAQDTGVCLHGQRTQRYVYMGTGHRGMSTWAQDTKHRGVTPTINPTVNITSQDYLGKSSQGLNHDQSHNVDLYAANMVDYRSSVSSPTENSSAPLLGNGVVRNGEIPNYSQNHRSWYQDRSVSASTTETVVPITPSESDPPPKSNNITMARNNVILQPHQGRNPTVARNTHKRSDEELAVSGNTLLGPGMEVASVNQLSENTYDSVGDNLETSLVQNDALNQHRNPPIPYLQNQVQVPAVRPKVANVPGNGVPYRHLNEGKSLREKIGKFIKPKELGLKLSSWNFFGLKSNSRNQSSMNLEQDHSQSNHSVNEDSSGLLNQANTLPKTVVQPVQTEICLQNGHAFVRPSNLALQEMPLAHRQSEAAGSSSEGRYPENRLGFAEVGVAKLKNSSVGQQSVVRLKGTGQSKSTSDLSPAHNGKSRWQETKLYDIADGQKRRPTSLSLRGHNYASQPNPYVVVGPTSMGSSAPNVALKPPDENSDPSEKIKKRIKTPVNMKKGRFSLYDDRLMCQGIDECVQNNTGNGLKKTSLSLHQLKQSDIIEVTGSQPQLV